MVQGVESIDGARAMSEKADILDIKRLEQCRNGFKPDLHSNVKLDWRRSSHTGTVTHQTVVQGVKKYFGDLTYRSGHIILIRCDLAR